MAIYYKSDAENLARLTSNKTCDFVVIMTVSVWDFKQFISIFFPSDRKGTCKFLFHPSHVTTTVTLESVNQNC